MSEGRGLITIDELIAEFCAADPNFAAAIERARKDIEDGLLRYRHVANDLVRLERLEKQVDKLLEL